MRRPSRAPRPFRQRVLRPLRRLFRELIVRPRAAYVVSYPKSGRTWLRLLLAETFAPLVARPLSLDLTVYRSAEWQIPYILFSHDGTDPSEWRDDLDAKDAFAGRPVLLLVRDPRDVMVSYYFDLTRRNAQFEGDLDAFIRSPRFGIDRMVDFLNSWARHRGTPSRFSIVRYEELHVDAAAALRAVLRFFDVADVPDSVIAGAVERTSFSRMQALERGGFIDDGRLRPTDPQDPESYKVRRGRIGGYAEYLTPAQVAFLTARLHERLQPPFSMYWT